MDIYKIIATLWAKTDKNAGGRWHPLILHMLDVAVSTDSILAREPESTRIRMAASLGMDWDDARPWILLVVACHDLGKACPGFQCKWPEAPMTGLRLPRSPNTNINHAFVSQIALTELLQEKAGRMNWRSWWLMRWGVTTGNEHPSTEKMKLLLRYPSEEVNDLRQRGTTGLKRAGALWKHC